MNYCCEVLSPHEQRVQDEIQGIFDTSGRERIYRILNSFRTDRPVIDVERARYFTESFRKTEGQPLMLRWAKALKHIAENITIYIDDHQLLVGRSGCQGRYGILYPELDGDFLDLAIQDLPGRVESPFNISAEDARIVIEEDSPLLEGEDFPRGTGGKPAGGNPEADLLSG